MKGSPGVVLTRRECGDRARISDEYIQLSKVPKHALHSATHAFHVTHVHNEHEHISAGHDGDDHVPRLVEGVPGARHDRNRSAGTRVLQCSLAPDAARCARDEGDFSAVGPGSVQWLGIDGGVDAGGQCLKVSLNGRRGRLGGYTRGGA